MSDSLQPENHLRSYIPLFSGGKLVDFEVFLLLLVLNKPVSDGCLTAFPLAVAYLLIVPCHSLHEDILSLRLSKRRYGPNRHLSHISLSAYAIIDAYEVRTIIPI